MKYVPIFDAIYNERQHQIKKYGSVKDHPHEIPGWIAVMESELAEAKQAWVKGYPNLKPALSEILQVIAVGVACLEQYGVDGIERDYDREILT